MTLLTALRVFRRRIFRRSEAVDAAPGVETAEASMVELGERLASMRGDNVATKAGDGHDTTMAEIAEIYDILRPQISPEFSS